MPDVFGREWFGIEELLREKLLLSILPPRTGSSESTTADLVLRTRESRLQPHDCVLQRDDLCLQLLSHIPLRRGANGVMLLRGPKWSRGEKHKCR